VLIRLYIVLYDKSDLVCFLMSSDFFQNLFRRRSYRVEYTGSLPTSEVKRHRARLVLGWGTAWEHPRVLSAFCFPLLIWHSAQCVAPRTNATPCPPFAAPIHCKVDLPFSFLFFPHVFWSRVSSALHWGAHADIDSWRRPRLPYALGARALQARLP
jgi:hypothetical protein